MRYLRFMLLLSLSAFASLSLAQPRVSLLFDEQYLCTSCGGSYSQGILKTVISSFYPNLVEIRSIEASVLRERLALTDVLHWPFQYEKAMAPALTDDAVAALRAFVGNGGKIVFKPDWDDQHLHNRDVVEKVFGVRFDGADNLSGPSFTCDVEEAAELGWQSAPAEGQLVVFTNFFKGQMPAGVIPLCRLSNGGVVVAAYPYGDGILYFDGTFSVGVGDLTEEQRTLIRETTESDVVTPHRCFVSDGSSKCSGGNSFGQLGVGDDAPHVEAYSALDPVNLGAGFSIARVKNSTGTSCALSMTGELKCWGLNKDGQLGLGDSRPRGVDPADLGEQLPPVEIGGRVVDFAVGRSHVCALTEAGELRCWGKGTAGQLGSEAVASVGAQSGDMPVRVDLGGRATAVHVGRLHTCALLDDKQVACFGDNSSGQLGIGTNVNVGDRPGTMGASLQRVDLGADFNVAQIATGQAFSCALSDRGQIKCWGTNVSGQLGQSVPTLTVGTRPEEMGDALPFVDLGVGQVATGLACGFAHCCATLVQNTMKCWGANESGQLGVGDAISRGRGDDMGNQLPFTQLPPLERVQAMDLVGNTTCATTESGTRCWGANANGQLATGDRLNRGDTPSTVPRLLAPMF